MHDTDNEYNHTIFLEDGVGEERAQEESVTGSEKEQEDLMENDEGNLLNKYSLNVVDDSLYRFLPLVLEYFLFLTFFWTVSAKKRMLYALLIRSRLRVYA